MSLLRNAIAQGSRVAMLIRHAERPALDPADATFGISLPITAKGRADAEKFGRHLAEVVPPSAVAMYASETLRTVQTAESFLAGMGAAGANAPDVRLHAFLGGGSPFFGPLDERMALIAEGRYMERLNDYYRTGEQRGYRPLAKSVVEMERWLMDPRCGGRPLVVAVTHDVNVASTLAGRGVFSSFAEDTWPRYLDAAIVVHDSRGHAEYGCLRAGGDSGLRIFL